MVGLSVSGNQELHADILRLFAVIHIMHYNICDPSRRNSAVLRFWNIYFFSLTRLQKEKARMESNHREYNMFTEINFRTGFIKDDMSYM